MRPVSLIPEEIVMTYEARRHWDVMGRGAKKTEDKEGGNKEAEWACHKKSPSPPFFSAATLVK